MESKPSLDELPTASSSSPPKSTTPLESLVKREDVGRVDHLIVDESVRRKRKWSSMGYGPDEIDRKEKTVTAYQLALLQDQQSTLFPAPPTAFTSHHDVVDRLLPYHVWQIHDEELDGQGGKRDAIRAQKDKNDAKVLTGMITKMKDRYTRIRRREGMFPSDLPSMISLINNSTHQVRTELDAVQAAQRTARTEFETLEAVRRARERLTSSAYPRPPGITPNTPARPGSSSLSSIQTQPSTPSIATQSSPVRPTSSHHVSPERGRGRGRPRGRGRGGAPTPSTSHVSTPLAQTPTAAPSGVAGKDDPGIVAKIKGGQPFKVNVPTLSLTQLIEVGIIADPAATPSKRATDPPAVLVDKSADGKLTGISMNLKKCNQAQLLVMARVLNIKLDLIKPGTGPGSSASPSTPTAKPPPPPAEPPRTDPNKRTRSSTTSST